MKNFAEILNDIQVRGLKLDKNEYIGKLANVPFLILDDLGMERDLFCKRASLSCD